MASPSEQGSSSEPAESGHQQVMGLSSHSSSSSAMRTRSQSAGRGSQGPVQRPPSPLAAASAGHRGRLFASPAVSSSPGPAPTATLEQQMQQLMIQNQQTVARVSNSACSTSWQLSNSSRQSFNNSSTSLLRFTPLQSILVLHLLRLLRLHRLQPPPPQPPTLPPPPSRILKTSLLEFMFTSTMMKTPLTKEKTLEDLPTLLVLHTSPTHERLLLLVTKCPGSPTLSSSL